MDPLYHECTKNIEVDCYCIREAVDIQLISFPHVSTGLQIVDIFVKMLTQQRHLVAKLMLLDPPFSI